MASQEHRNQLKTFAWFLTCTAYSPLKCRIRNFLVSDPPNLGTSYEATHNSSARIVTVGGGAQARALRLWGVGLFLAVYPRGGTCTVKKAAAGNL